MSDLALSVLAATSVLVLSALAVGPVPEVL